MEKKERILCAAIWYQEEGVATSSFRNIETGYVMCGLRHSNIIHLHFQLTGKTTKIATSVQGFITSFNHFVNRREAMQIVIEAEQVDKDRVSGIQLFSEDLY